MITAYVKIKATFTYKKLRYMTSFFSQKLVEFKTAK